MTETLSSPSPRKTAKGPRRIRVAMILYRDDLSLGGSLRVVEAMAKGFDARQVDVHLVFAYGEPGPISESVTARCHFLRTHGPKDLAGWRRARRIMAEIAPDLLHFHNPVYWLHAALAGTNYKKIIHLHGPFFISEMKLSDRVLSRIVPQLVQGQVCITDEIRDLVLRQKWGKPEQTWTVYNGIDTDHFSQLQPRQIAREVLGLPRDKKILAMVCRLAWYKGCQDGIDILSRLDDSWHIVFCGDGPIRPDLIAFATRLGIEKRIHFTGMLSDVRPVYAAANAFLFLSRLEPFGLVIAESMAARLPVFGLAGAGGYRDKRYPLVTSENAVMGERADVDDFDSVEDPLVLDGLADRIMEFGLDPERFRPMVDKAEQWVRERFNGPVQAESMVHLYKRICKVETEQNPSPGV